jgi:hypothetical protein
VRDLIDRLDRQFTIIFVVVAVMQASIVAYARNQPYVEAEPALRELLSDYNIFVPPEARPPVAVEQPQMRAAETPRAAPAPKSVTPVKVARSRGLLAVIGAMRKNGGAIDDLFDEGRVTPSIEKALDGAKGIEVGTYGSIDTRRDPDGGGSVELEVTGPGVTGQVGGHTKREAEIEVDTEPPVVDGPISEADISRVMQRNLRAMRDCYEHALKRDPTLAGKIFLRFDIEETGRVEKVDVESSTLKSDVLADCIERRSKAWRFPQTEGEQVSVTYPILFFHGDLSSTSPQKPIQ